MGVVRQLEERGVMIPTKHVANSAAIVDMPELHYNMVRPGILIYGLYPSKEVDQNKLSLKQAMSFKAKIAYIKEVEEGTFISYGRTYRTKGKERIATIPLGYADGYPRNLSGKSEVLIGGRRVPVVGNICMDQMMVRLPKDLKANIGDEVVIFGRQGEEIITVDEIAQKLNVINYEVVCSVSKRVPRLYFLDGELLSVDKWI